MRKKAIGVCIGCKRRKKKYCISRFSLLFFTKRKMMILNAHTHLIKKLIDDTQHTTHNTKR